MSNYKWYYNPSIMQESSNLFHNLKTFNIDSQLREMIQNSIDARLGKSSLLNIELNNVKNDNFLYKQSIKHLEKLRNNEFVDRDQIQSRFVNYSERSDLQKPNNENFHSLIEIIQDDYEDNGIDILNFSDNGIGTIGASPQSIDQINLFSKYSKFNNQEALLNAEGVSAKASQKSSSGGSGGIGGKVLGLLMSLLSTNFYFSQRVSKKTYLENEIEESRKKQIKEIPEEFFSEETSRIFGATTMLGSFSDIENSGATRGKTAKFGVESPIQNIDQITNESAINKIVEESEIYTRNSQHVTCLDKKCENYNNNFSVDKSGEKCDGGKNYDVYHNLSLGIGTDVSIISPLEKGDGTRLKSLDNMALKVYETSPWPIINQLINLKISDKKNSKKDEFINQGTLLDLYSQNYNKSIHGDKETYIKINTLLDFRTTKYIEKFDIILGDKDEEFFQTSPVWRNRIEIKLREIAEEIQNKYFINGILSNPVLISIDLLVHKKDCEYKNDFSDECKNFGTLNIYFNNDYSESTQTKIFFRDYQELKDEISSATLRIRTKTPVSTVVKLGSREDDKNTLLSSIVKGFENTNHNGLDKDKTLDDIDINELKTNMYNTELFDYVAAYRHITNELVNLIFSVDEQTTVSEIKDDFVKIPSKQRPKRPPEIPVQKGISAGWNNSGDKIYITRKNAQKGASFVYLGLAIPSENYLYHKGATQQYLPLQQSIPEFDENNLIMSFKPDDDEKFQQIFGHNYEIKFLVKDGEYTIGESNISKLFISDEDKQNDMIYPQNLAMIMKLELNLMSKDDFSNIYFQIPPEISTMQQNKFPIMILLGTEPD